jgi:hypothetical protein
LNGHSFNQTIRNAFGLLCLFGIYNGAFRELRETGKEWMAVTLCSTGVGSLGIVAKGFLTDQIWLGWAKPSEDTYGPGLSDEYVAEVSYRLQLTKNVSLLSDIQLVFNPALNPAEDRVWVLGFRTNLAL